MAILLTPNAKQRFFDANGDPLVGGKLYTYQAGTTTPKTTYTSPGGAANANPVILDANGECDVWILEGESYKFLLANSSDVTQWTVDDISLSSATADSTTTKTTTYTATVNDDIILVETASAWTLSLFTASGNSGKLLRILKTSSDTNELTIDPNSTETINGFSTVKLKYQFDEITLISNGTNWNIHSQIKSPTTQRFTSGSGTYTTPAGVKYLNVYFAGGGGGGGSVTSGVGYPVGSTGGTTTFGSFTAIGGSGGTRSTGGIGGTGGSGTATLRIPGTQGNPGYSTGTGANAPGGSGGNTPFFCGAGPGGVNASVGGAATANTGGGGGGSGGNTTGTIDPTGGGGSGEYVFVKIYNPTTSYSYAVGGGGAGGTGSTYAGGAAAAGQIYVEEHYQ